MISLRAGTNIWIAAGITVLAPDITSDGNQVARCRYAVYCLAGNYCAIKGFRGQILGNGGVSRPSEEASEDCWCVLSVDLPNRHRRQASSREPLFVTGIINSFVERMGR
jgi:hypothetical protein